MFIIAKSRAIIPVNFCDISQTLRHSLFFSPSFVADGRLWGNCNQHSLIKSTTRSFEIGFLLLTTKQIVLEGMAFIGT